MHEWGDEDFDWRGLGQAGNYIADYCFKRARLRVLWKEKYGTIRYEYLGCSLFSNTCPLESIFYPGHMYYRLPKWVRPIDKSIGFVLTLLQVTRIIQKYQLYIFKKGVLSAIGKWPHLEDEIMEDACHYLGDEELISKYWN